jgi:hypothetical protein
MQPLGCAGLLSSEYNPTQPLPLGCGRHSLKAGLHSYLSKVKDYQLIKNHHKLIVLIEQKPCINSNKKKWIMKTIIIHFFIFKNHNYLVIN